MKTLLLVRHGKSSWEYSVGDRNRPLNERGINDALLVSTALETKNIDIDAVFSSPANRALHTSTIFLRQLNISYQVLRVIDELYDFSGDEVLRFIKNLDDRHQTVMIFGHNHAFTHLANSLGNSYIDNVPTSGLVALNFTVDSWSTIAEGTTTLTIFPKQLRA